MNTPILSLKNLELDFGGKPLFTDVNMQVFTGDRICLIGRNGSGKSSLLKIIAGVYDQDKGDKFIQPALKISYLEQLNITDSNQTIYNYLIKGQNDSYRADIILSKLDLDGSLNLSNLSGGQLRRTSLAKALIEESDLLLLDEPTNHLDIKTIEWLEDYVSSYKGALICISHDRQFLKNISSKIFWLDNGIIKTLNKNYQFFEEWSEEIYALEARELVKSTKKLAAENLWLQQGVTARRKRNQRRLKELFELREKFSTDKSDIARIDRNINLPDIDSSNQTKIIIEFKSVSYGYNTEKKIINDFTFKVVRGEKIALIGPNGVGKTSLIKLITKDLAPDDGSIKFGKNLKISYFDQKRSSLNAAQKVRHAICPNGDDTIIVNGEAKHINSYMKDFMFNQDRLNSPISSLSGGEANRLLLAKLFADPGNLLILDEPTNDLDMETLDMLQELLYNYQGTLLIVSHDRDFLERIVTRSLVFDDGKIIDFIGGYQEYKKQIGNIQAKKSAAIEKLVVKKPSNKLSYKYVRELELLPIKIEQLENEIKILENSLSDSNLYQNNIEKFQTLSKKLIKLKQDLSDSEDRWLELEEMSSNIN